MLEKGKDEFVNLFVRVGITRRAYMSEKSKESRQVRKARKKLKKQLEEEKKLITPSTLAKMERNIQRWIQRHSAERISLKDKNIALFDENKHAAHVASRQIKQMRHKIKDEIQEEQRSSLKGRIKPQD